MKILENNRMKDWVGRETCPSCHSILEIEKEDVYCDESNQPMIIGGGYYYYCPVCYKKNYLRERPNSIYAREYIIKNHYTHKHIYNPNYLHIDEEYPDYPPEKLIE